jgi:hypothetical protein
VFSDEVVLGLVSFAPEATPGQAAEGCVADSLGVLGILARLNDRSGRGKGPGAQGL